MLRNNEIIISKQDLIELYVNQRKSTKEIAKIYNTTSKTILRKLHKNNIEVRHSNIVNRKYYFNEKYFDSIDTQSKAYTLGLLCADGWIAKSSKSGNLNMIGFMFQDRDIDLIDYLKEEFDAESSKTIQTVNSNAKGVTFCSVYMANKLKELYGITDNKSLTLNIGGVCNCIRDELVPSFLLGYFDGDGGIYSALGSNRKTIQWSCGFTGTLSTCEFLKSYFKSGFIVDEKSKNRLTYTYKISGRKKVVEALERLYSIHNGFCLLRKKEKFLKAKSPTNSVMIGV